MFKFVIYLNFQLKMKKLNFNKISCILILCVYFSIFVSCGRSNDDPKPTPELPREPETEKCIDDKAINKGEDLPCKYEEPKPEIITVSVSVVGTESFGDTSNEGLVSGTRYRAIFYKEDGSYFAHNDYVVDGHDNQNFSFEKGGSEKYTVVVYSFNSTEELPEITEIEKENIKSSVLDFDINQGQLMYARVENYQTNKGDIEVKLKHKFSTFSLVIDNSATLSDFYKIEKVEYAKISNNQKGKISLSSGEITERTDVTEQDVVFLDDILPLGTKSSSVPVRLNVEGNANLTYKLKTDLYSKVGTFFYDDEEKANAEKFKDKEISKSISVQDTNYEEVITKQKCGAWVSDTKFLEFMCQNLGATASSFDYVVNLGYMKGELPNITADAVGAKYQWGRKKPALTQEENLDPKKNQEVIGWDSTSVSDNNAWNSDFKTALDPCPNGYRIPDVDEISALYEHNEKNLDKMGDVGVFLYRSKIEEDDRFVSGLGLGYFLLLQSDGYRDSENGEFKKETNKVSIAVTSKHSNPQTRRVTIEYDGVDKKDDKAYGVTVRCVKE